ncbi:MAG: hypothetical protein JW798_05375 [Prolixibacteraceae bacterium]|nr:hypothetical protein [Prolixibacteraceae bacterium]
MKQITIFITLLALLAGCIEDPPESTDWNINIDYFAETLEKHHKNLFFNLSKEDFYGQIGDLKLKTENLSDAEVVIELSKILTNVGDSHTNVDLRNECFTRLPFSFLYLNDGLFCYRTPANCTELLGEVISGIDQTGFEDIYSGFGEIIPHENDAKLQTGVQNYLSCSQMLEYLEIAENGHQLTFQTVSGLSVPVNETELSSTSLSFFSGKTLPLYIQDTNTEYWMKALPDEKLMYVQYNSCSQMDGYSFSSFKTDVMNAIKDNNLEKMVIDLRWNGGGNSLIFYPLLNAIRGNSTINQNGNLYVIIGKFTFSSALLNAIDLKQKTNAILLGEPTGGKPNHYGEVKSFNLNKLNLKVYYSTNFFKNVDGDPPSLEPDVFIPIKSEDMRKLKDPCLDYILNN